MKKADRKAATIKLTGSERDYLMLLCMEECHRLHGYGCGIDPNVAKDILHKLIWKLD